MCKAHNLSTNLCNAWKLENEVCLLANMPYLVEYTLESQRMPFYVEHTKQALEVKCRGGDDCCSLDNICKIGEGDCDVDEDCFGLGLICGTNNCIPNSALYDNIDDCCTRRCTVESPCAPGEGQCQLDEDCKDPEFNKCDKVATCVSQIYFPSNEFPDNVLSNYSSDAYCCRRRCYPNEQCQLNEKGCADNNDCTGLKCEAGICIHWCSTGDHTCDLSTSECINNDSGYTCNCLSGYRKKDDACVDIDECAEDSSLCKCASCINTIGNYKCECASTSSKRFYITIRLHILT